MDTLLHIVISENVAMITGFHQISVVKHSFLLNVIKAICVHACTIYNKAYLQMYQFKKNKKLIKNSFFTVKFYIKTNVFVFIQRKVGKFIMFG